MRKFKPTNRTNPCESCGDTKGNCRTTSSDPDFILCMTATDRYSTPSGWRFKGLDSSQGMWGLLSRDRGESNSEFDEVKRQREQKRKERLEKEERDRIARLPKIEQRDREYRQRIRVNALDRNRSADCYAFTDILRRGLTYEQIREIGIFTTIRGYAVPIYNLENKIVGAQVKSRNGGGYRWLENGLNQLAETNQLPLAIWGNRDKPTQIILTEGTGLKPYITSQRFPAALVVGASGGHHTASSKELQRILEIYRNIPIYLMPDGGAIANTSVFNKYKATRDFVRLTGRELKIGWWGQAVKADKDIDEIGNDVDLAIIDWPLFEEFYARSKKIEQGLYRFSKLTQRKNRDSQPIQLHREVDREYSTVADLEAIYSEAAMNPNIRAVLDISIPGSGKSTLNGQVRNVEGIKTHMYVSAQHRNPTTPEVEIGYSDVTSRHDGLFINPDRLTPTGRNWLQTSQPDGAHWQQTDSNCHLAKEQRFWREAGHADIDNNPICNLCPHNSICHISSGEGYGYKRQRNAALAQSRVRISPMAMPNPATHDYSQTMTIWDDQEQIISRQITATVADIDRSIGQIVNADIDLAIAIEPIFTRIKMKLDEPSRFGHDWDNEGIEIDDLESKLHRVAAIVSPDLANLRLSDSVEPNPLKQWGFSVNKTNQLALEDIPSNWLVSLLEIMTGKVRGTARISNKLTIKLQDNFDATVASKVALTVVLNATKSKEDLALELNIDPSQILVISQPMPSFENLTIYMVDGMGSPTKARQNSMNDRVDRITAAIAARHGDCAVIDKIKDFTNRALWFRDSVGSNAFKQNLALLMVGVPMPNLGAMAEEFSILTGNPTTASSKFYEFTNYLNRKVAGHVIQGVGRLRAQHRPTEQLHCYIISDREDFPISEMMAAYPGATLKVVAAEDICLEAAGSTTQLRVKFAQLLLANPNITRVKAAQEMCVSGSTLTRMFKGFGQGFEEGSALLYKALYSKADLVHSNLSDWSKYLEPETVEYLTIVLDSPETTLEEKAVEVANIVKSINSHHLSALFDAIGLARTDFAIELLRYDMFRQVPYPIPIPEQIGLGDPELDLAS